MSKLCCELECGGRLHRRQLWNARPTDRLNGLLVELWGSATMYVCFSLTHQAVFAEARHTPVSSRCRLYLPLRSVQSTTPSGSTPASRTTLSLCASTSTGRWRAVGP